ncbi:hypothetical protein ECOLIN_14320 [Escherichia coli Nissle 1917]|nr:hypothetical protein ECOLIN_14320 [Escherichia coli Nissle 1917]
MDGRKKILWDSKKRRNEALDCFVYALAALRISISRWQLDLSALLPIVSGEVIRSRGGSTSEQMTLRRLPDEDPQNLADPAYRRRRIIMQNMRDGFIRR